MLTLKYWIVNRKSHDQLAMPCFVLVVSPQLLSFSCSLIRRDEHWLPSIVWFISSTQVPTKRSWSPFVLQFPKLRNMDCFGFLNNNKKMKPRGASERAGAPAAAPASLTSMSTSARRSTASIVSQKSIPELYEEKAHNLRAFEFDELMNATNNFSRMNKIGEGGFGSVYRGHIKSTLDGVDDKRRMVAIKKLNQRSMQVIELHAWEILFSIHNFDVFSSFFLLGTQAMASRSAISRSRGAPKPCETLRILCQGWWTGDWKATGLWVHAQQELGGSPFQQSLPCSSMESEAADNFGRDRRIAVSARGVGSAGIAKTTSLWNNNVKSPV